MRFHRVQLQNWRNFTRVNVKLQQRVFVAGPNAAGKSNLFDALRFLQDIVSIGGGFQDAIENRDGVSKIRCLAARKSPDIGFDIEIGNGPDDVTWRYMLVFGQDNQRRPIIKRELVEKQGEFILQRPDEDDRSDSERLRQTHLEQVNANRLFREIAEFLGSLRYLHVVPQLVRDPERTPGRLGKERDPFGGDFLEQIARSPKKILNSRLRRINEALSIAVPQLSDLQLLRDELGTPHLLGRYEHWRKRGAWQNEVQFSDGTLRLMGLLWAVMDGTGPLLLEEPELSLHPEVVRFIPQMLWRATRRNRRQVFISTHSSDLLSDSGIALDEVLLLTPDSEGTRVVIASDMAQIANELEAGLSMADAVMPRVAPRNANQLPLFGDT